MQTGLKLLDSSFLEMRWRCLSMAADLDRIHRAAGGMSVLQEDERVTKLRRAINVLLSADSNRAEQVQMIFSDMTPPPTR